MKTPLALLNLLHDKTRTLVAIAGVAFAVVLVLMQLGFLNSVRLTATEIYEQLIFDVVLVSPRYLYISKAGEFPRTRLFQAESTPGVADVRPLYLGFNFWLNHDPSEANPSRRGIFVIGFNLEKPVFRLPPLAGDLSPLKQPGHVYMDTFSRKQFGRWRNNNNLEVGMRRIQVAGEFSMGTGFGADGDIIVSDQTFKRLFPNRSLDEVSLGLIRVAPGADPAEVAARLRRRLPPDVQVYTRGQIEDLEREHWVNRTSVGVIFSLGVVVGFIVGTAIVYQVLSSDITNHIAEYATLKAIGYGPRYLAGVVLTQALILSVLGFLPGWAISRLLYSITSESAKIPMELGLKLSLGVLAMSIVMCSISGLASLRKVTTADPADLF
ncbi:MAG TPA: ABC transporter permease DevC [Pirellulales bacterium]|nr:ABC transporter permease DevC [Pirellulales bacterium]